MKLLIRHWIWWLVAIAPTSFVLAGRSNRPGYGLDPSLSTSSSSTANSWSGGGSGSYDNGDRNGRSSSSSIHRDVDIYDELQSDIDEFDKIASSSSSPSFNKVRGGQKNREEYDDEDFDELFGHLSDTDSHHLEEDVPFDKEVMYAAYNELHTLAQSFQQDFDAPAVVVVGHQSSGKSALIEALMGFQFNQVGGGTKTRRPIALRMCYNPNYDTPRCYLQLLSDREMIEKEMSLEEIQDYIEQENNRLERDPLRSFDSREINIRMEYKHCPNLILIDTPGLIAAPKISASTNSRSRSASAMTQQRALLASAQEAERLVVNKLKCPDYLIVCVEDTADWKHGPTREVVQRADPDLSRTVLVNTKLDTKLPQFGSPRDIQDFLRAVLLDRVAPQKLGGPYYTSIPAGRVGGTDGNNIFADNAEFVKACAEAEVRDRTQIQQLLRRGMSGGEDAVPLIEKVGLRQLRKFLEEKVDETYRRNVNKILPMLKSNLQKAERRLLAVDQEMEKISLERLKAGANVFCDEFCLALRKALQGSVVAPSNIFGETLSQEKAAAGSFNHIQNSPMAVSDRTYDRLVEQEVGHQHHQLYGGSQYHRAVREFNLATRCLRLPTITEDEIANAAGVGTTHDGVNFLHAACVIALEKSKSSFEPMVEALRIRVTHVMQRLCPIAEYMIRHEQEGGQRTTKFFETRSSSASTKDLKDLDVAQNPQFRQLVRRIFEKFVRHCSDSAVTKCQDDLGAITKYVSWNMDERSSGALRASLPDQADLVAVYNVALKSNKMTNNDDNGGSGGDNGGNNNGGNNNGIMQQPSEERKLIRPLPTNSNERDYFNLLQLMEEAICSRDANRTNMVVGSLVQHIVAGWRESFGRTVTTKFNCYFMLPFVDEFQKFMREEFQALYDNEDLADVFDVTSARRSLQLRKEALHNEIIANKRLHEQFQQLSKMMLRQRDML